MKQWDGLRPQNVVQAARADIARRRRNEARREAREKRPSHQLATEEYENYAFLREHVREADGAFGIIERAISAVKRAGPRSANPEAPLWLRLARSTNTTAIHLYETKLLKAALEMEKTK